MLKTNKMKKKIQLISQSVSFPGIQRAPTNHKEKGQQHYKS